MTILEYKKDEHPSGFIGFRVVRTLGANDDYRQKYFSINKYGYDAAKVAAQAQDLEWKKVAENNKKNFKNKLNVKKNSNPGVIVNGLRAYIIAEKKLRREGYKHYYTPCFIVKKPGVGNPDITFRITKHGYRSAYVKAVKKYCELHALGNNDKLRMIALLPDRSLFMNDMLKNLRDRGHKMTKKYLAVLLD